MKQKAHGSEKPTSSQLCWVKNVCIYVLPGLEL